MTADPATVRQHTGRVARMVAWVSIAAPLITPLVHAAVLRWPAIGALVGLFEVTYRVIVPAVPPPPPGS